jgi:hypothetical protein
MLGGTRSPAGRLEIPIHVVARRATVSRTGQRASARHRQAAHTSRSRRRATSGSMAARAPLDRGFHCVPITVTSRPGPTSEAGRLEDAAGRPPGPCAAAAAARSSARLSDHGSDCRKDRGDMRASGESAAPRTPPGQRLEDPWRRTGRAAADRTLDRIPERSRRVEAADPARHTASPASAATDRKRSAVPAHAARRRVERSVRRAQMVILPLARRVPISLPRTAGAHRGRLSATEPRGSSPAAIRHR